jgi:hypothetical protein
MDNHFETFFMGSLHTQNHVDPPIFPLLYSLLEMVGGGAPLCFDLVLVIFVP